MRTKQLLCWSGMTDIEYTSGSNEEDLNDVGVILVSCANS